MAHAIQLVVVLASRLDELFAVAGVRPVCSADHWKYRGVIR